MVDNFQKYNLYVILTTFNLETLFPFNKQI